MSSLERLAAGCVFLFVLCQLCGCRECKPAVYPLPRANIDAMSPTCGPETGGTIVTIYGFNLSGTTDVKIGSTHVPPATATAEEVTFVTPAGTGTAAIELTVGHTVPCKNGKEPGYFYTDTPSVGDFEYSATPRPALTDADPTVLPGCKMDINPNKAEGNCGGGYTVEIEGKDFSSDVPMVIFNDIEVRPPDVYWTPGKGKGSITCVVPPGDQGATVSVVVKNAPYECELTSEPSACFFYKQDPCVPVGSALEMYVKDAGPGPQHLATGDVFNDGASEKDVVVACANPDAKSSKKGAVIAMKGDGSGNLISLDVTGLDEVPSAVAVGNFDGDAYIDAVVTQPTAKEILVLLNSGIGYSTDISVATHYGVGSGARDVVVADLDNDGDDDIVVANTSDSSLSLLAQTAPKVFASAVTIGVPNRGTGSSGPIALSVGDFDNVGGDDLIVATSANSLEMFLGATAAGGTLLTWADYSDVGATSTIVDVRAYFDGATCNVAALCSVSGANGKITLIKNDPTSGYFDGSRSELDLQFDQPLVLWSGDYNDNDKRDFAVGNANGVIEILMYPWDPKDATQHDTVELTGYQLGDVVSDKMNSDDTTTKEDLVVGSSTGATVTVILNIGTSFTKS